MATCGTLPYFLTVLLQDVHHLSALATGLAFLVPSVSIAAGTQAGGWLANGAGIRTTLLIGLAIAVVGTALLALGFSSHASFSTLVPGLVVEGLGQGITWTVMWVAAAAGVADHEQGVANGVASTTLNLGNASGLAVLVAISDLGVHGQHGPQLQAALAEGGHLAVLICAAGMLLALAVSLALPRQRSSTVTHHTDDQRPSAAGRPGLTEADRRAHPAPSNARGAPQPSNRASLQGDRGSVGI
jgi:MFS family permease